MAAEIVVVPDLDALAREAALRVAGVLRRAIAERGWGFLALPAGPFARPVYDELVLCSLDWSRVEFYFWEERGVPPGHPASAFAEADLRLFDNPRIGAHQVHRVEGESSDLDEVATRYAEECPEELDVLLAEPGDDGHLGALLPGSPAFDEDQRLVIPLRVPTKPVRRVTFTPRKIASVREAVVVAHGAQKAAVVARVLEGDEPPEELPAALLRGRTWVLDPPAASLLRGVAG
jgi:6-phosphogluconolactonase